MASSCITFKEPCPISKPNSGLSWKKLEVAAIFIGAHRQRLCLSISTSAPTDLKLAVAFHYVSGCIDAAGGGTEGDGSRIGHRNSLADDGADLAAIIHLQLGPVGI